MTEQYEEKLNWLAVSMHEAAHVAAAFIVGETVTSVVRLSKTHKGETIVAKRRGKTKKEKQDILFRRLVIVRAPLALGGLEEEWASGDLAESAKIAAALEKSGMTRPTERADLYLKHVVSIPCPRLAASRSAPRALPLARSAFRPPRSRPAATSGGTGPWVCTKTPSRQAAAQSRPSPSARRAARIGPPEAAMRAIRDARVSTDEQDSGLQHQRRDLEMRERVVATGHGAGLTDPRTSGKGGGAARTGTETPSKR